MHQTGVGYAPPCLAFGLPAEMCEGMEDGRGGSEPRLEILDRLLIPAGTPPGDYVLGWRWDCGATYIWPLLLAAVCACVVRIRAPLTMSARCAEESNQIWQSCSDVTIQAP
jgi:hypothetical protein